jgi:hypothetical protein
VVDKAYNGKAGVRFTPIAAADLHAEVVRRNALKLSCAEHGSRIAFLYGALDQSHGERACDSWELGVRVENGDCERSTGA